MDRVRRQLSRKLVTHEPNERWNVFVDLLATEESTRLSPTQRVAHLAFWYDSEVQNGGHLQYFENEAGREAEAAIVALRTMGAACQADCLAEALRKWNSLDREASASIEDYVDEALEDEFGDLDARYASCEPSITALLEQYLDRHEAEFIEYDAG